MPSDGSVRFAPDEVLAAVGQAVIATDVGGRVAFWNHPAEDLYLWSAAEALGRPARELVEPVSAPDVADDIRASVLGGGSWSGGIAVRRRDGTSVPVLGTVSALVRDGVVVGVVSVSTNIGAALRPILERSTDAAIVLRADAVVTYASPAVDELFGWSDSIVGTSIVDLLHPDERSALASFMEEVVHHPGAHPALDVRVLTEAGWVWAEAAVTNLLDDPAVRGFVCNLRRSSHRQEHERMERRIEQLTTALQTRVVIEQAKGFLAAAHGLEPDEAFEHLRRYSRSHHVTIHEVSRGVVARELRLPV